MLKREGGEKKRDTLSDSQMDGPGKWCRVAQPPPSNFLSAMIAASEGITFLFSCGQLNFLKDGFFWGGSCALDCSYLFDWQSDVLSLPYFVSKSEAWVVQRWIRVIAIPGHCNNNHTYHPSPHLKQHFFLKKSITVKKCLSRPSAIREEESSLRQSISISSFGGGEREKTLFVSPPPS